MKFLKAIWRGARVWLIVTACVLALLLTASLILTQWKLVSNTFSMMFGDDTMVSISGDPSQYVYYKPDEDADTKAKALAKANALNEEIVGEGIVLLKNDKMASGTAALPLAKQSKVTVLGKNSVDLVYGGSGSGGADTSKAVRLRAVL